MLSLSIHDRFGIKCRHDIQEFDTSVEVHSALYTLGFALQEAQKYTISEKSPVYVELEGFALAYNSVRALNHVISISYNFTDLGTYTCALTSLLFTIRAWNVYMKKENEKI